jgi:hypothetical protein
VKDLSKDTVSVIVGALVTVRSEIQRSLDEAMRVGHVVFQATLQQELDTNAAAVRELNQEVAPWLEYHPQLRDVFDKTGTEVA